MQSIIKKYKNIKCIENLTIATTDRLTQRKLKLNQRKSVRTVTFEFDKDLTILISESTVKRWAHEVGLFDRVVRKKPYVNETNRPKMPQVRKRKSLGFWDAIVWSDESKFNLSGL